MLSTGIHTLTREVQEVSVSLKKDPIGCGVSGDLDSTEVRIASILLSPSLGS